MTQWRGREREREGRAYVMAMPMTPAMSHTAKSVEFFPTTYCATINMSARNSYGVWEQQPEQWRGAVRGR
jgi:hypothetical protein